MTYIHWAWCFLYEFTWSCYSTSVTPMSHSWVTTLNDQWGKSKSCHIIWSHASCSCAVTVYSHSQLTVLLPPHAHAHTHTCSAYTHFLWCQGKPAEMKTATLNQFCSSLPSWIIHNKQRWMCSTALVAQRAKGPSRATWRRRTNHNKALRILSSLSDYFSPLLTVN